MPKTAEREHSFKYVKNRKKINICLPSSKLTCIINCALGTKGRWFHVCFYVCHDLRGNIFLFFQFLSHLLLCRFTTFIVRQVTVLWLAWFLTKVNFAFFAIFYFFISFVSNFSIKVFIIKAQAEGDFILDQCYWFSLYANRLIMVAEGVMFWNIEKVEEEC